MSYVHVVAQRIIYVLLIIVFNVQKDSAKSQRCKPKNGNINGNNKKDLLVYLFNINECSGNRTVQVEYILYRS